MAIVIRRGAYADFVPSKLQPGEFADVQSGDPNTTDGKALYICLASGNVVRIASSSEIDAIMTDVDLHLATWSGNLAPEYSSSSGYSVGDFAVHNSILYKCRTAIPAGGEAWNSSHWTQTTIMDLVPDIDTTLTVSGDAADAKKVGDEIINLKENFDPLYDSLFFKTEILTSPEIVTANNNTALTNNEDGTYTIGTTDRGTTTFGSGRLSLDEGDYFLYGVPNGIAFLSPDGRVSQAYNQRVFENSSPEPKIIHVNEHMSLWVCYRVASNPNTAYTIRPSLVKITPIIDSTFKIKGVLEADTDVDTVTGAGLYLLSSSNQYVNAPVTGGFLIVLQIGSVVEQICTQYGPALIGSGTIYKRDGTTSGVSSSWQQYGRVFAHSIAFFGDSIMWGRDGSGTANTRTTWQIPTVVARSLGCKAINYGVSGQGFLPNSSTSTTAYSNISSKTLTNFDTLVMCYGANDGYSPLGDWDSTDENTIMGQFNKIVNYIYAQNPNIRLVVFAPFNGTNVGTYPDYWYGQRNDSEYVSRKVLSDTLKRACDYYWIPYIEQYDGPINAKNISTLLPDGVHPNETGYKMIGEWFAAKIGGLM